MGGYAANCILRLACWSFSGPVRAGNIAFIFKPCGKKQIWTCPHLLSKSPWISSPQWMVKKQRLDLPSSITKILLLKTTRQRKENFWIFTFLGPFTSSKTSLSFSMLTYYCSKNKSRNLQDSLGSWVHYSPPATYFWNNSHQISKTIHSSWPKGWEEKQSTMLPISLLFLCHSFCVKWSIQFEFQIPTTPLDPIKYHGVTQYATGNMIQKVYNQFLQAHISTISNQKSWLKP